MRYFSALGLVLLLVGCADGNGVESDTPRVNGPASPSGTLDVATASPSAGVSATPSIVPSAASELAPDTVAHVVTTDLVLRSAPGTTPESEIYGMLDEPTPLYVLTGPVSASGYEWYQVYAYGDFVRFTPISPSAPETRLGWVADAGKDGEPWIASASLDCVDDPQVEHLIELGVGALACYGDRALSFPAMYRTASYVVPSAVSPLWLMGSGYVLTPLPCAFECPAPTPTAHRGEQSLFVHWANVRGYPNLFGYEDDTPIQVVGHFDDPAARSCTSGPLPGGYIPPPEEVIVLCRAQFVVTEVTAITR